MRQFLLLAVFILLSVIPVSAQKYGHLNFANLRSEMPGIEAAEGQLEAYNQELVQEGERMVTALRSRVEEVQGQMDDLPPVRLEELRAELARERDAIAAYEQQVPGKLEVKRQELLGPLIQEARDAIDAVAKENGYEMIFDTSLFNSVLYGKDSDDLMDLVKAKLGI